jgi:hypothetical protein
MVDSGYMYVSQPYVSQPTPGMIEEDFTRILHGDTASQMPSKRIIVAEDAFQMGY